MSNRIILLPGDLLRCTGLTTSIGAAALVCGLLVNLTLAEEPAITSPAELWQGFDPEIEPLEVEVSTEWEEEDGHFEKLFFTGEAIDGAKVRVFAIRGAPTHNSPAARGLVPGILHIHGGGQTASLDWVKFWARRGFACVSFDFCGKWENRTEFTDWGPLKQGNMADAQGGLQVDPTPRASSWYHWARIARRALTLLAEDSRVDGERLGIFGVSVGGTLCWMVAGADARVRAAVPIYGCGYNYDNGKTIWGFDQLSPKLTLWQQAVSAEAHAPYIRCPVLLLNATNDFHGWLDHGPAILQAVPAATRAAFSPNWNHHIRASEGVNLPAWMDANLRDGVEFPEAPTIRVTLDQSGVPQCQAYVDDRQPIDRVEVYYALGTRAPPNRFWRCVAATRDDGCWNASLPVMQVWQQAHIFANVYYARPICLSSQLKTFVPGQLGIARATLRWSPELSEPGGWRHMAAHTDPSIERTYLLPPDDPLDPGKLRINAQVFGDRVAVRAASNFLGDPQFVGPPESELTFNYRGNFDSGLSLSLFADNWTPQSKTFRLKLTTDELLAEPGTVRLTLDNFKSENGDSPSTWRAIDTLQIEGEAASEPAPEFGQFRWHSQTQ